MGTRPPQTQSRLRLEKERCTMRGIRIRHAIVVALFLVLWSALSCSTHAQVAIHHSDVLSVALRTLPARYPSLAPFHYAHVIDQNDTFAILESLAYHPGSRLPVSQGERHRVLTRHQAELLAPELAKALNLALPHEVAAFTVSDAQQSRLRTKGLAFVHGDDLHLIIEELCNPFSPGEHISSQQQGSGWELLPGDRQRRYVHQSGGTGAIPNWIITPLH
jgi:hypothetical protein